ncbi:MAG: calcium-binding protein, partial [Cyanobacteria bacterium J06649_11]
DGFGNTDRLFNIEDVTGSSFNDTLVGSAADNTFVGGDGDDTIDGLTGTDTVNYSANTSGVNVDLANGTATGQQIDTDTLVSIEQVFGSQGDDTIVGSVDNNLFVGGTGNDDIDGGDGRDRVDYASSAAGISVNLAAGFASDGFGDTDTLTNIEEVVGSRFNDNITGDTADNIFIGGAGDDIINGDAGNDTVDYSSSIAGVTVNLDTGIASEDGFDDTDFINNIENITGSTFNDNLTGDAGVNLLSGGNSNDTLSGGAGNDTLDGGAGRDRVNYSSSPVGANNAGVIVRLDLNLATDGFGGLDTLLNIEEVEGSNYNDGIQGNSDDNYLSGGSGEDLLIGSDGNDTLLGGAGDDTLDGGVGIDRADYSSSLSAVTVDLVNGTGTANDGIGGNDILAGIEQVVGSIFNDSLIGNNLNNVLVGGEGNDNLNGDAGDDILDGGAGNDTMDGGSGIDRVSYSLSTAGVVVDLANGIANDGLGGTDTLSNIENSDGSIFEDRIIGNASDNSLVGNGGNDTLIGGSGNDVITGVGAGSSTASIAGMGVRGLQEVDILTGGAGNDRFILGDNNEVYYLGSGTSFNDVAIIGTEKPAGGYTGDFNIGDVIQLQKGFIYELEESGTNTFIYGVGITGQQPFLRDTMAVIVDATIADVGASLQDQNGSSLQLVQNNGSNQWFV